MAYTTIIQPADLNRSIYQEILDEITRADATKITTAISTAIEEVKMYLSRYDLIQLFGDKTNDIAPSFTEDNDLLKQLCVDIACWRLIRLANPNVNYEVIKDGYEQSITVLKNIQSGKADPKWPYQDTTGETAPQGNAIYSDSNPKKSLHF